MSGPHVADMLDAQARGALSGEEAARVAAHVLACASCSEELGRVREGQRALEVLRPQGLAPGAWDRLAHAVDASETALRTRRARLPRWMLPLAAGLLVATLGGWAGWRLLRDASGGRPVETLAGAPRIDGRRVSDEARMARGAWLETPAGARARVSFGPLGHVDVEPHSRVRVVASSPLEQRLELDHGTLVATVTAPPRLFVVDTTAATAVDLGCAYELALDASGVGGLEVFAGSVALVREGLEIVVDAGARCPLTRARGPGVPTWRDADAAFCEGIDRAERGDLAELDATLALARPRDAMTLLHLVPRVGIDRRAVVVERLAVLVPPPQGVTTDDVLALDGAATQAWLRSIEAAR